MKKEASDSEQLKVFSYFLTMNYVKNVIEMVKGHFSFYNRTGELLDQTQFNAYSGDLVNSQEGTFCRLADVDPIVSLSCGVFKTMSLVLREWAGDVVEACN